METCTLWQEIAQMRIEPAGATRTFGSRLAEENGWSRGFAAKVEAEYRRFLYLAATGQADVTPSDAVDQAWHLHLSYTRHYWDELCGRILGKPLHHGPSAGGPVERQRYRAQYEATLARYEATFGAPPPADVWPDADTRFAGRWRRVDADRMLMIPKPRLRAGLALSLALPLAACAGGLFPEPWLPVALLGFGAFLLVSGLQRKTTRKPGESGCGSAEFGIGADSDCSDSSGGDCGDGGSGCGGGCS